MHGNYVRSLFTIETGHGMRSSLSKECICDGRGYLSVQMYSIIMCAAFKADQHCLKYSLRVCKKKKVIAKIRSGTHCWR